MAGAIDLAAVKARTEAAARAVEQSGAPGGSNVVEVTEATFQSEVLDRSFAVPVLIDLWADWCGPCKQLSPVLERLANEADGAWVLAKIDVDANPRISQALQVQSIPTVFAVIGGQLIPGFQGALPEPTVREFVAAVLQAGNEAGLTGAPAEDATPAIPAELPDDPRFTAAEDALASGDYATATERYQAILNEEPGNPDAAAALRQLGLLQRIDSLDPQLVARADSEPDNLAAQLAAADYAMAGSDVAGALSRLVELIRRVSGDERDLVRDRIVEYFDLLGPDDPRVPPARRALASALF
jgi:putative thioredoxin